MRKKKEENAAVTEDDDGAGIENIGKFASKLISQLNNGDDKIAWNLARDVDNPTDVKEFISTGSTLLDYAISNRKEGGIPVGKLSEISGEESSGKSLICAHIIKNTQKKGGLAVYIDTENAANPAFMKQIGVDLQNLVYIQPNTIEEVFETIEKCINSVRAKDIKKVVTIIWDSVAATPPKAELEGSYDPNSQIGLMARVISKGMRKLTQTVGKDRITLVFTNQLKFRPGVMYGDPMTTPGGKAIPYHASVRVKLAQSTKNKNAEGDVVSIKTLATVKKTRLGPPLRQCNFEIFFDRGIEDVESWRNMLHEVKEIEKRGGFMYMKNVPITEHDDTGKGKVVIHPEYKFRESHFKELLLGDEALKNHVLALVEKHMIVSFDKKSWDMVEDVSSELEGESSLDRREDD